MAAVPPVGDDEPGSSEAFRGAGVSPNVRKRGVEPRKQARPRRGARHGQEVAARLPEAPHPVEVVIGLVPPVGQRDGWVEEVERLRMVGDDVGPDHGPLPEFADHARDPVHVSREDRRRPLAACPLARKPLPEIHRFVAVEVRPPRGEVGQVFPEHVLEQRVRSRGLRRDGPQPFRFREAPVGGFLQDAAEVAERLEAGDELDAAFTGPGIELPDLRRRVPPRTRADLGMPLELEVCRLGVEEQLVVAEPGQDLEEPADGLRAGHLAAARCRAGILGGGARGRPECEPREPGRPGQ